MCKSLRLCFASLLIVAFCAIGVMAQSQASTGQISGLVTDSNGAAVANATVKATNKDNGLLREATASGDGLYTIVLLPPGKYTLVAESSGFSTGTIDDVVVNVGQTNNVNFSLGAGGVQATVLVTAEAIQATRNESDAVLNETAIQTLPINGRRFQDFVTLTPTAQVDPQRGQISLSGQKGINGNINVDGMDFNQPFFGGIRGGERSNQSFTIPQEAIKEFQVIASGYSAEFGRSTGGIVNAVTKSGDNSIRGSAFYLLRPQQLARGNDFTQRLQTALAARGVLPTLAPTQHQFGGSVGGPIKKDKMFWFFAYEQQRFRAPRQIFFTNFPVAGLNAAQQAVADFYNAEQVPYIQTNDAYAGLGRLDWNINNNHRFNVRYSASKNNALNAVSRGETVLDPTTNQALSTNGTEKNSTKILVGQLVSNFGSNTVNELRFQWAAEDRPRISNSLIPQIFTGFGTYGATAFLPTTQNDTRYQVAEALTYITGNHNFKFGGEYSRLFASQVFGFNQFGAYALSIGSTQNATTFNITDTYQRLANVVVPQTIVGTTTNFAILGRFDDTRARYNRQIGNLQASFKVQQLAFFGQDSWRVTPKLTINYGLRAEAQYNPAPEANNTQILDVVRNTVFPITGRGFNGAQIPDSGWQWGPRLGFAYDPEGKGKMVIRAFAGQYFATTPLLVFAGSVNNYRTPPGDVSTTLPFTGFNQTTFNTFLGTAAGANYKTITGCDQNAATGTDARNRCTPNSVYRQFAIIGINLNNSPLSSLPILTTQQVSDIAAGLGLNPNPFVGATVTGHAEDFKNPRSFQWGFAIEREVARNFVLGVDYSTVITDNVQRNRDLNLPAPLTAEGYIAFLTANNTAANVATMAAAGGVFDIIRQANRSYIAINSPAGLTFPSGAVSTRQRPTQALQNFALGPVQVRESSAKALYRSLTIRGRLVRKRVLLNTYLTLSRLLTDDDNERDAGGVAYAESFNLKGEYWKGRLDRESQFTANPIFFLPYGFEVSSAIRLRSAVPVNANANGDLNGDGTNNDRPLQVPGLPYKRNWFRNFGLFDLDARVQKSFKFDERKRLILSVEFFNLFNRMNIIFPNAGTATTTAAGQFCGTASQVCGLSGPTNTNFLRATDPVTGNYINGATPGSQVFQMQLGARFQF